MPFDQRIEENPTEEDLNSKNTLGKKFFIYKFHPLCIESNREQNLNSLGRAGNDIPGQPMGARQSPRGKNFLKPGEGKGSGRGLERKGGSWECEFGIRTDPDFLAKIRKEEATGRDLKDCFVENCF